MKHARSIVRRVCDLAGQVTCIDDLRHDAIDAGLVAAVEDHDTPAIFDWLIREVSHQGISDAVADGYMDRHGNVTWAAIAEVKVASEPEALLQVLANPAYHFKRIGLEAGPDVPSHQLEHSEPWGRA